MKPIIPFRGQPLKLNTTPDTTIPPPNPMQIAILIKVLLILLLLLIPPVLDHSLQKFSPPGWHGQTGNLRFGLTFMVFIQLYFNVFSAVGLFFAFYLAFLAGFAPFLVLAYFVVRVGEVATCVSVFAFYF